jgi:hypothetical protein
MSFRGLTDWYGNNHLTIRENNGIKQTYSVAKEIPALASKARENILFVLLRR